MKNKGDSQVGAEKTVPKRVPKLRFPEFRDAPEWEEKRLGEIAELNPRKNRIEEDTLISFIPMNLISEQGYLIEYKIKKYSEVKNGFTSFRDNDIVFAKITPCFENGKAALLTGLKNGMGMGSTEFHVIRVSKTCLPEFVFFYLYTDTLRLLGRNSMKGSSGQQRVPSSFFENYTVYLPNFPEQQKIADCLTSIDELISAQSQKLEKLKSYKKGLLQQLFPAERETVPGLRFPEFRDAPEWEEKRLGEVCDLYDGYAFSSNDFTNCSENAIQVVRITDINNQNTNIDKVFIPISLMKILKLDEYFVYKGDLVLSLTGAAGFNFYIWSSSKALLNQRTMSIALKEKQNTGLKIMLKELIHNKINTLGTGQNNNLSKALLEKILFFLPFFPEQQKIADCLTSIDELISAQSQKLEKLKSYKKGFLQQLFPETEGAEE